MLDGTKIDPYGTAGGLLVNSDTDSDEESEAEATMSADKKNARIQQLEEENLKLRQVCLLHLSLPCLM